MQTVKSNDLTGLPLDWAVAKAMGLIDSERVKLRPYGELWCHRPAVAFNPTLQVYYSPDYSPSTKWEDAGHVIALLTDFGSSFDPFTKMFCAHISTDKEDIFASFGKTALIALMRCFVESKLGEEVEVPEELIGFSVES